MVKCIVICPTSSVIIQFPQYSRNSGAQSISYNDPLLIVKGKGSHLYDQHGKAYLDLVNNVCHGNRPQKCKVE